MEVESSLAHCVRDVELTYLCSAEVVMDGFKTRFGFFVAENGIEGYEQVAFLQQVKAGSIYAENAYIAMPLEIQSRSAFSILQR